MLKLLPPKTRKQVQSLLGLAGYYRRFLLHYSDLTYPLTALLKKYTPFRWTEEADNAFMDLKSRLSSIPILKHPDYTKPFLIAVDASSTCLGAVRFQITDELEYPVCYLSRKLRQASTPPLDCGKGGAVIGDRRSCVCSLLRRCTYHRLHLSQPPPIHRQHAQPQRQAVSLVSGDAAMLPDDSPSTGKEYLLPDILSRPAA